MGDSALAVQHKTDSEFGTEEELHEKAHIDYDRVAIVSRPTHETLLACHYAAAQTNTHNLDP